jgi:hypothetical protein
MDPGGTDWSDWAWDYTQNCWYRARKDAQGLVHYDFQAAQTAPRGNVDDLANSLSNVNLGGHQGTHYTQDGAYTYGAPIPVEGAAAAGMYGVSSAQSHSAFSPKGQGRGAESHSKPRSRDKPSSKKQRPRTAKAGGYEDPEEAPAARMNRDPFYRKPGTTSGPDYPSAPDPSPDTYQGYVDSYESPHGSAYASGFSQSSGAGPSYGQGSSAEPDAEAESPDPGTVPSTSDATEYPGVEGEDGSRRYSTDQESVASATSSDLLNDALSQEDIGYTTGEIGSPYSGGESSSMAQGHIFPVPEPDNGRETPRPLSQRPMVTMGTDGYQHQVNGAESITSAQEPGAQDGYVVERSSRFQPGEVFKIFWCEPLGAGPPKSDVMTHQVRFEQGGRSFYQGLRRFIVVANDEGHCTCV